MFLKHQSKEKFRWRQQRAVDLLEQRSKHAERAPPIASLKLVDKYKSISDSNIPIPTEYPIKKSDFSRSNRAKLDLSNNNNHLQHDYSHSRLEAPPAGFSIKDPKLVMMGSMTAKNMELYKLKFSRRTNMIDKANVEEKLFSGRGPIDHDSQLKAGLVRFNIRRELSEKKIKVKLPSLTPKASTKLTRVGSETSRGTIGKYAERFAAMNSPHGDSNKPKSTVLDDFELPTPGGITPIGGIKKGRFADMMHSAEIPSGIYNIIKRVNDNKGMFSPSSNNHHHLLDGKDDIRMSDDYMMNNHIKKAPKRMAGGFTVRRKISEDGRPGANGASFSVVAKKKDIF